MFPRLKRKKKHIHRAVWGPLRVQHSSSAANKTQHTETWISTRSDNIFPVSLSRLLNSVWKQHSSSLCTKSELNKLNTAASCSKDYSVQKNVWQSAPGYVIGRKASHPTARCWLNYVFFVFVVDTKSATSVLWRLLFFSNHKLFLLFMFKKKHPQKLLLAAFTRAHHIQWIHTVYLKHFTLDTLYDPDLLGVASPVRIKLGQTCKPLH